ncbi:hypothetical protein [Agreia pratensis]|uniref:Uncharacterized protein n=1 Tax=Agreia pratensis TaxID=150121 RepID=A0A1X7K1Q2_9MICO|nr:hypothetical protein [Agreia pratensis]SMG34809.1 hypothetical protein SAMN06296010_1992 [Agreia pratensis]
MADEKRKVRRLTFKPDSIILVESSFVRGFESNTAEPAASVAYEVTSAQYRTDNDHIQIVTECRVNLHYRDDPDALIATLRSKYALTLIASKNIRDEDAKSGALMPGQSMGVRLLHPYHRSRIAELSSLTGMTAFELPITWEETVKDAERSVNGTLDSGVESL